MIKVTIVQNNIEERNKLFHYEILNEKKFFSVVYSIYFIVLYDIIYIQNTPWNF